MAINTAVKKDSGMVGYTLEYIDHEGHLQTRAIYSNSQVRALAMADNYMTYLRRANPRIRHSFSLSRTEDSKVEKVLRVPKPRKDYYSSNVYSII